MRFLHKNQQYDTDAMIDLEINHGEFCGNEVLGLFMTKVSRRLFVWTRSSEAKVGYIWYEASHDTIADFAQRYKLLALTELLSSFS